MARAVIIGMGQIGLAHAANIAASRRHSLVGLCDSNRRLVGLVKGILPDTTVYTDSEEMLEAECPDAVFICTPASTHLELATSLMSRKDLKAMFVEKPLATNSESAKALTDAAESRRLINAIGFQRRFMPSYKRAKSILEEGVLGEVKHFQAHMYDFIVTSQMEGWKAAKDQGGALVEWSPHILDLLLWFFGEPTKASSFLAKINSTSIEDYFHAMLSYPDGLVGFVDVNWCMLNYRPFELGIEVHGSNGFMTVTDEMVTLYVPRLHDEQEEFRTFDGLFEPSSLDVLLGAPERTLMDRTFLDSVDSGQLFTPGFIEGLRVHRLTDLIRKSSI
jgi:predicted dehydrogenase